jgi:hypothetical protein
MGGTEEPERPVMMQEMVMPYSGSDYVIHQPVWQPERRTREEA